MPSYILRWRHEFDLKLLTESIRSEPSELDMDVVIGERGPIAPPEMCNGLMVPTAVVANLYSFDHRSFLEAIPRPEGVSEDQFHAAADEVLRRIIQLSDNAGSSDEHRVLNFQAVSYAGIYVTAYNAFAKGFSLSAVEVRPSRLSITRRIFDTIFVFTHRQTGVTEKYFTRADATGKWIKLLTPISPYYDR